MPILCIKRFFKPYSGTMVYKNEKHGYRFAENIGEFSSAVSDCQKQPNLHHPSAWIRQIKSLSERLRNPFIGFVIRLRRYVVDGIQFKILNQ